jgi:hypothetical protein
MVCEGIQGLGPVLVDNERHCDECYCETVGLRMGVDLQEAAVEDALDATFQNQLSSLQGLAHGPL